MPKQAVIEAAQFWVDKVPEPNNFMPGITDWLDGAIEAFNDPTYPWCAAAVSLWMYKGGERDLCEEELGPDAQFSNGFASTDLLAKAFEDWEQIFKTPEIGDLVLYDFDEGSNNQAASVDVSHVGLVVEVGANDFTAIEGNTSLPGEEGEGKGVYEKTRLVDEAVWFARPNYEETPQPEPPPPPYNSFLLEEGTVLPPTDPANWTFTAADYNGDGVTDLIGVKMNNTDTGTTEVHVLDVPITGPLFTFWLVFCLGGLKRDRAAP